MLFLFLSLIKIYYLCSKIESLLTFKGKVMVVLAIILFVVFFKEIVGAVFGLFSIVFGTIGAILSAIFGK